MAKTIDEALQQLKREPGQPVRAMVEGLTVEVRVVPDLPVTRSAAALFAEIGPWEGETTASKPQLCHHCFTAVFTPTSATTKTIF